MTRSTLASVATLTGSLVLLVGLGAWRTTRVRVTGPSMEPTYVEGDRLLVWRTQRVLPGQVAVVRDPRDSERLWVKRVHDVTDEGVDVSATIPSVRPTAVRSGWCPVVWWSGV
jgi:signal peptidase I